MPALSLEGIDSKSMMRKNIALLLALAWITVAACNEPPEASNPEPIVAVAGTASTAESPATGSAGMVSSAHPMATQAGSQKKVEGNLKK